jgi:phage-related protein
MTLKPIIWVGSSKSDLIDLSEDVQDEIGHALYQAQKGERAIRLNLLKALEARPY